MDRLKSCQQNTINVAAHPNQLIPTVAAIVLVPFYILVTCAKSYARPPGPVPQTAVIHDASDAGVRLLQGRRDSGRAGKGMRLQKYDDGVGVPGNRRSLARLSLRSPRHQQIGALAKAGPASTPSAYTFPCKVSGTVLYGWRKGRGVCGDQLWVVPLGRRSGSQPPDLRNIYTASTSKTFFTAQASLDQVQYYCGAVADSGGSQGSISVGLPSAEAACQEATQKCLEASPGDECSIVSLGEWSVNDPDLMVSMQCELSNSKLRVSTSRGSGSTVATLLPEVERLAKALTVTNCVPSIYHPDDLIVSPTTDEPTLIQTNDLNGNIEINILAGAVNIISAQRPNGLSLNQGSRYRRQENVTKVIVGKDCENTFNSESVEDFLDADNWPQDVAAELREYQDQIQQYRQTPSCQSQQRPPEPRPTPVPWPTWPPFPRPTPLPNNGDTSQPSTPPPDNRDTSPPPSSEDTPPPDNGDTSPPPGSEDTPLIR